MDRWDFPAVHLRNIPQMHHVGKVPFGYRDGRFFNLTGPYRTDTAHVVPGKNGRYRVFSKMLLIIQTLLIYWQEIVLRLFREAIQELYPKHKLHLDGKIALQIK